MLFIIIIYLCAFFLFTYREKIEKDRENENETRTSTVNRLRSQFELNIFSCEYELFGLTTILNSNRCVCVRKFSCSCVCARCTCAPLECKRKFYEQTRQKANERMMERDNKNTYNQMHFSRYQTEKRTEKKRKNE